MACLGLHPAEWPNPARAEGAKMLGISSAVIRDRWPRWLLSALVMLLVPYGLLAQQVPAPRSFTVNVVDGSRLVGGTYPPIGMGFRWILEEDVTFDAENPATRG